MNRIIKHTKHSLLIVFFTSFYAFSQEPIIDSFRNSSSNSPYFNTVNIDVCASDTVQIFGSNLTSVGFNTSVTVNNNPATIVELTSNMLKVILPTGTAGSIITYSGEIKVQVGPFTANQFGLYAVPCPIFDPALASGLKRGDATEISGSDMLSNITGIYLSTDSSTSLSYFSVGNSLQVTVPEKAALGTTYFIIQSSLGTRKHYTANAFEVLPETPKTITINLVPNPTYDLEERVQIDYSFTGNLNFFDLFITDGSQDSIYVNNLFSSGNPVNLPKSGVSFSKDYFFKIISGTTQSALVGPFRFIEPIIPTITGISPMTLYFKDSYTITGKGFLKTELVQLLQFPETSVNLSKIIASDSIIIGKIPDSNTGVFNFLVSNGIGYNTTSTQEVTIVGFRIPVIDDFNPKSGLPFTEVTVTGSYLDEINYSISVGANSAFYSDFLLITKNKIIYKIPNFIQVPTDTTDSLSFYGDFGIIKSQQKFTLLAQDPPVVDAILPSFGSPDTRITFSGSNLKFVEHVSFFPSQEVYECEILNKNQSDIHLEIKILNYFGPDDVGTFRLYNSTDNFSSFGSPLLEYNILGYRKPFISSIIPSSAYPGDTILINGGDFEVVDQVSLLVDPTSELEIFSKTPNQIRAIIYPNVQQGVSGFIRVGNSLDQRFDSVSTQLLTINTLSGQVLNATINKKKFKSTESMVINFTTTGIFSPSNFFSANIYDMEGEVIKRKGENTLGVRFGPLVNDTGSIVSLPIYVLLNGNTKPINNLFYVEVESYAPSTASNSVENIEITRVPYPLAFEPFEGPPGTVVTITGYTFYLSSINGVRFKGINANYEIISENMIITTVPGGDVLGDLEVIYGTNESAKLPFPFGLKFQLPVCDFISNVKLIGSGFERNKPYTLQFTINKLDSGTDSLSALLSDPFGSFDNPTEVFRLSASVTGLQNLIFSFSDSIPSGSNYSLRLLSKNGQCLSPATFPFAIGISTTPGFAIDPPLFPPITVLKGGSSMVATITVSGINNQEFITIASVGNFIFSPDGKFFSNFNTLPPNSLPKILYVKMAQTDTVAAYAGGLKFSSGSLTYDYSLIGFVQDPKDSLTFSDVKPSFGVIGTVVTIKGNNFFTLNNVLFDSIPLPFFTLSDSLLYATITGTNLLPGTQSFFTLVNSLDTVISKLQFKVTSKDVKVESIQIIVDPNGTGYLEMPTDEDGDGIIDFIPDPDTTKIYITKFGGVIQLIADVLPQDASNQSVKWSISNPQLANIDSLGKVTAKLNGVVTVTGTSVENPNIQGNLEITLVNQYTPVVSMEIFAEDSIKIFPLAFESLSFDAHFVPEDATNQDFRISITQSKPYLYISDTTDNVVSFNEAINENAIVTVTGFSKENANIFSSYVLTLIGQALPTDVPIQQRSASGLTVTGSIPRNPCEGTLELFIEDNDNKFIGAQWFYILNSDTFKLVGANTLSYRPLIQGNYYIVAYDDSLNHEHKSVNLTFQGADKPLVSKTGDSLVSTASSKYQWFVNGKLIRGATKKKLKYWYNGKYSVLVNNDKNCKASSDELVIDNLLLDIARAGLLETDSTIENYDRPKPLVFVQPNPSSGKFTVEYFSVSDNQLGVSIINNFGSKIYESKKTYEGNPTRKIDFDIDGVQKGLYFVQITDGTEISNLKIVIE